MADQANRTPAGPSTTPGRVLYIAGYGRSGSTVLDIALSAHPAIEGFGELTGIFDELAAGHDELGPATDGLLPVVAPPDASAGELADLVSGVERLVPATALLPRSRRRRHYLQLHGRLLDELFRRTGADVLVDSSKSSWLHTWRLPLLGRVGPEVRCLVLIRSLDGVVRSVRRGRGDTEAPQARPTTRAVLGWSLANVTATATALLTCGRAGTRLVTHDQVAAEPRATLEAVVDWLGLEPSPAIAIGVDEGFPPGHQIQGNRVRRQHRIRLRPPTPAGEPLDRGRRLVVGVVDRAVSALVSALVPPLDRPDPLDRFDPLDGASRPARVAGPGRAERPASRSA